MESELIVDRRLPVITNKVTLMDILDEVVADGLMTREEVNERYRDLVEDRMVRMGTRV